MTVGRDFDDFVEKVLIEVADRQTGQEVKPVDLSEVSAFVMPDVPPTWIAMAGDHLRSHHYGTVIGDSEDPERNWFLIESSGVAYASRFRKHHKPPTLSDKLASDKFQKIGNLGLSSLSLLISLGALIVAIIALSNS